MNYHILLEKPMSVTIDECALIYKAVVRNKVILAVGHVLRYTQYTKAIKRVLDSNVLGDIVNIQHLEPVGFWHFAHSVFVISLISLSKYLIHSFKFVRGNWHNESESTFSLLAKCCHDIDLLSYMVNEKCTVCQLLFEVANELALTRSFNQRISSFGSLSHFKKEKKPKAAENAVFVKFKYYSFSGIVKCKMFQKLS